MSKKVWENQVTSSDEKDGITPTKSVNGFFDSVAKLVERARTYVGRTADLTMCVSYFEIGRMIVEEEQGGKTRAEYGRGLLKELSSYLTDRLGRGFSLSTLKNAKRFYNVYASSIQQSLVSESSEQKSQTLFSLLEKTPHKQKGQTLSAQSYPFTLGWSHYLILMRIDNPEERRFYEIEATRQQWTFRQLQRQYGSSLYERLALSRDKDAVMKLAKEGQALEQPQDMLKNPLVLEFLGMEELTQYSENDLETAIISKLQTFLLELGKGFLFEARQKRFTFNEEHFMVDLVLYNRLLKCYVLIDLKTGILKHQDLGQMQMYVHYFDRSVKTDDELPTVGILLCQEKNDAVVELTLPEGENIYASEYSLYLPDKTLLKQKLIQWTQEFEEAQEMNEAAKTRD
ncbi:MAG: PDDEXK nuclease domain-containing protein [Coriobacteriales bacterium]|jgi:predicted nuclease of restriction endonuclease-like (RecB) superfamily|nr:PDDEXK nuclease domain-containing protein [Coriobacteriales bacterium]